MEATPRATSSAPESTDQETYHLGRAWYSLVVSELQILAAGIDIAIVSLLVHPIESSLRINDVGFSVITAIPLAIGTSAGYYLGGPPADIFRRRYIVAIGSLIWTLGALVAARAGSGNMVFLARLMAGLGTSVTGPAMFSILSDAFPRSRRAFAVSIYLGGIAVGSGIGLAICGALVEATQRRGPVHLGSLLFLPWQECFVLVTALGILVLFLSLTIPEPPRRDRATTGASNITAGLGVFVAYLRRHWVLWSIALIGGAIGFSAWVGSGAWGPVYGMRHYGITGAAPIALLGVCTASGALLGSVMSGLFVQRGINRNDPRIVPRMLLTVSAICGVAAISYPYMPSWSFVVVGMGLVSATGMAVNALMMMAIQEAAPNEVRGQLFGVWGFIANAPSIVIPTFIAILASGILAKAGGLGPALAVTGGFSSAIAVLMFSFAGRSYERARQETHEGALAVARNRST